MPDQMLLSSNDPELSENVFHLFRDLIHRKSGISISGQKISLVKNRIGRRISHLNLGSYYEYYRHVCEDSTGELGNLINSISTNKTSFFREAYHFDLLKDYLSSGRKSNKPLMVFSAGCASGEEAYSIAMIISDHSPYNVVQSAKILATDINTEVLDLAEAGEYDIGHNDNVPPGYLSRHFVSAGGSRYTVSDNLRSMIRFRRQNLIEPFPFRSKFQFIFCRNVMIYFDFHTQQTLVEKFYDHLEPGGYLFIGHSESLGRFESDFVHIEPAVYMRPK